MESLSILIPVYNHNVQKLALELQDSIAKSKQNVEVIFADDTSTDKKLEEANRNSISEISGFRYISRQENLGYCENRNALGREASNDYLLFLDADVRLNGPQFISDWFKELPAKTFVCGGNIYQNEEPENSNYILKWKHGKSREEASAEARNEKPHLKFWASNFLVPKELFMQVPFDRKSKNYGYNDTVYAYLLMKAGIPVIHIDNPVVNTGLMEAELFIKRMKEAVANLLFFEKQDYIQDDFYQFISLLSIERKISKLGLKKPVSLLLRNLDSLLKKNLLSNNPRLRYLDLLKLHFLFQERAL